METSCEKDEEGIVQLVVSNLTPIAFQAIKEITMFVNEDLWSLHVPLPSIREIEYRTTISPTSGRPATEGEVTKKAKKD